MTILVGWLKRVFSLSLSLSTFLNKNQLSMCSRPSKLLGLCGGTALKVLTSCIGWQHHA